MSITSVNDVINGLAATTRQRFQINKASVGSLTAGRYGSLWRATGTPPQANLPTTAEVCDKNTLGAWAFNSPTSGQNLYLASCGIWNGAASLVSLEVHDRLVQIGGFLANSTATQTVGLNLTSTASNLQTRIGPSDLSDILWWFEVNSSVGSSTSPTVTVNVTHTDNSSGTCTFTLPSSTSAANIFLLYPNTGGKFIKSIDSFALSSSTGNAGNIGFAASRRLTAIDFPNQYFIRKAGWPEVGLPLVNDYACLYLMTMPAATTSGISIGHINVIDK